MISGLHPEGASIGPSLRSEANLIASSFDLEIDSKVLILYSWMKLKKKCFTVDESEKDSLPSIQGDSSKVWAANSSLGQLNSVRVFVPVV